MTSTCWQFNLAKQYRASAIVYLLNEYAKDPMG
ncbi:MAG: hypothetical protein RLZZ352_2199, partial [Pseudomonadota bacterium]